MSLIKIRVGNYNVTYNMCTCTYVRDLVEKISKDFSKPAKLVERHQKYFDETAAAVGEEIEMEFI